MATRKKLFEYEAFISLGNFVRESAYWLIGPAIGVGGPMYLIWESVTIAAEMHGWLVYPFVILLSLFAFIGIWMFIAFLNNRLRLMTEFDVRVEENTEKVRELANRALQLATDIDELIGEYQTRPPTLYTKDIDSWQKENWDIRNRMFQKFMSKYATKAQTIILESSRYTRFDTRTYMWRMSHVSDHDIAETRQILITVYLELDRLLQEPITLTTRPPHQDALEKGLSNGDK